MLPFSANSTSRAARARAVCLLVVAVVVTACGNRDDAIQEVGAEQLYEEGSEQLLNGNYAGAITTLENLRLRYPFSPNTRQARLDLVYAYYRMGETEIALEEAQSFIVENPRLPEVAYCLYMLGLLYFDREPNIIERLFRVDVTQRPPRDTQLAFDAFQQLVRQFPDSIYVDDARQRMIFLRNRLAMYENHVARYYISRGAYVAAINRMKFALEHYPGAPELEESLSIMIESYESLGMQDLAADARRVQIENFGDLRELTPSSD
jgi:outer membrane protein assembly factor BamD